MVTTSKTEMAMAEVIQLLLDSGFQPAGETRAEEVRMPTRNSPVFGMSGGELAKFGGRQRFAKLGTNIKATVGKRTTAVYRVDGAGLQGVTGIASLDTSNIQAMRSVIAQLPA